MSARFDSSDAMRTRIELERTLESLASERNKVLSSRIVRSHGPERDERLADLSTSHVSNQYGLFRATTTAMNLDEQCRLFNRLRDCSQSRFGRFEGCLKLLHELHIGILVVAAHNALRKNASTLRASRC
jgi:hypothetical protein